MNNKSMLSFYTSMNNESMLQWIILENAFCRKSHAHSRCPTVHSYHLPLPHFKHTKTYKNTIRHQYTLSSLINDLRALGGFRCTSI